VIPIMEQIRDVQADGWRAPGSTLLWDVHSYVSAERAKTGTRDVPDVYGGRNDAYPAASATVSIEYNASEGRHATACRDVPVGSVLLVERAYASVLLQEYGHSHCANCFVK